MNDEIKEILDNLIENKEGLKDKTYYPEDLINSEDLVLLLDYITNLQQEIEKLNEDKRGMLVELYKLNDTKDKIQDEYEKIIFEYLAENCGEFEDEHMEHLVDLKVQQYINLQQENEYLKLSNPEMNIEHFRIINENKRKINNLREQNKTLQESNQNMQEEMARVWEENERLKNHIQMIPYRKVVRERDKYKSRCEKAVELLESVYMLDNLTITNNACEKIDNAINILQNGSDDNE